MFIIYKYLYAYIQCILYFPTKGLLSTREPVKSTVRSVAQRGKNRLWRFIVAHKILVRVRKYCTSQMIAININNIFHYWNLYSIYFNIDRYSINKYIHTQENFYFQHEYIYIFFFILILYYYFFAYAFEELNALFVIFKINFKTHIIIKVFCIQFINNYIIAV